MQDSRDHLNIHRDIWEKAQANLVGKIEEVIVAAAMGHYEAYSYLAGKHPDVLEVVDEILETNLKWQSIKQILIRDGKQDKAEEYTQQIKSKNDDIAKKIREKGLAISMQDIKPLLSIESPISLFRYYLHVLSLKVRILSSAVFGKNDFLAKPRKKQADFSKILAEAKEGKGYGSLRPKDAQEACKDTLGFEEPQTNKLQFEEHRVQNDEGQILEMLRISRNRSQDQDQDQGREPKNIIIYVGGRTDNFAFSTKHVLDQFWALPAVDEFWHVNPRHVSLSASINDHNYDSLVSDTTEMYKYISNQNEGANITMYGMCAGSPIACQVAQKQKLKFFSDRSFSNINKVIDKHIGDAWWVRALLWLPRLIRSQYLKIRGFDLRQDKLYTEINPANRALHSVAPSKSSGLKSDGMTKDSDSSLHACPKVKKEVKEFNDAFKELCEMFHDGDAGVAQDGNKRDYVDVITDEGVRKLLQDVLVWHKDRKSFGTDQKRDPHTLWPSKLQSRSSNKNPMWRLNLFAATPKLEDEGNAMGVVEKYAYPIFQMPKHEAAVASVRERLQHAPRVQGVNQI